MGTKSGNSSGGGCKTGSPERQESTLTSAGKLVFPLTEAENDVVGSIVAKSEIVIAESHATGALNCEATGKPVAVAMGNLLRAGEALRKKFPKAKLIVCADHDAWAKKNPGESKARDAARVLRAKVAFPTFQEFASLEKRPILTICTRLRVQKPSALASTARHFRTHFAPNCQADFASPVMAASNIGMRTRLIGTPCAATSRWRPSREIRAARIGAV